MKQKVVILMITILSFSMGVRAENGNYTDMAQAGKWLRNVQVPMTYEGQTSTAKIQIYFPKDYVKGKYHRTVIALHQYDNNERDWETSTPIESLANKFSMVIVCPSMDKTLYETAYYPETEYKWNIMPGGKFIGEALIKFMNETFSLATKKEGTGLMGITVGAHGAVLIAAQYNEKFGAAAGVSGYYDPTTMQTSRMVESIYGSYKKNQLRWENDDNVLKIAEKLKGVNVYLYHGFKTDAFNPGQSQLMAIRLKQLKNKDPLYNVTYRESKSGGYGWLYWRSQTDPVMEFLNENLK